jgi:antitoxin (DNA-binding transcriptional repressor) of toxin-antitoxin stability system
MPETTFTDLRNHAKTWFDLVEAGQVVRVFRKGKPIAEIHPYPAANTFVEAAPCASVGRRLKGDQSAHPRRARGLMRVYFDTSAFAKRDIDETGTAEVLV